MALIQLPESWRRDVSAILNTKDTRLIQWTRGAGDQYQRSFPAAIPRDVYQPLIAFLTRENAMGCEAHMDYPSGETYEFFFNFYSADYPEPRKTYGKILLLVDRQKIKLFSAHLPEKPRLRCE
jgi:hypothetical protein